MSHVRTIRASCFRTAKSKHSHTPEAYRSLCEAEPPAHGCDHSSSLLSVVLLPTYPYQRRSISSTQFRCSEPAVINSRLSAADGSRPVPLRARRTGIISLQRRRVWLLLFRQLSAPIVFVLIFAIWHLPEAGLPYSAVAGPSLSLSSSPTLAQPLRVTADSRVTPFASPRTSRACAVLTY
jgi:hypothetical protein